MEVSVVIPTRGDVDLSRILDSLKLPSIGEIIVWEGNSVWGRYQAAMKARNSIVYTQDDDCVTDAAAVIRAYDPGFIVNAMTPAHNKQYPNHITLLGFGSIFDRSLISVMDDFEHDDIFMRECDRVFTALVPHKSVYPKIEILPCAKDGNRLCMQKGHESARQIIARRINDYKNRRNQ